jgi:hypothetical protein
MATNTGHSPLPEPYVLDGHYRDHTGKVNGYSADQMRKHAKAEVERACNSYPLMVAALHMAKHIVAQEGTDEQAEQVFRALESAGEKA